MPQEQNSTAGYVPLKDPSAGYVPLPEAAEPAEQPGAVSRFASGFAQTALPSTNLSDYWRGPAFAVQHPIESAKLLGSSLLEAQGAQGEQSLAAFKSGDIARGISHGFGYFLPVVGPPLATAGERMAEGDVAGGLGMTAGVAAPLAAGKVPAASADLSRVASEELSGSAAKNLEQVLGATTQKLKAAATEDVVPGMQERGIIAASRKKLLAKANQNVEAFGKQVLEEAQKADQTGRRINTGKLVARLENLKEDYMVRDEDGEVMGGEAPAVQTIAGIQDVLKKRGNSILPTTLINFRRFLDDQVARSQQGFLLDDKVAVDSARKWAANGIRDEINTEHPNLARVNAEFSFWQDLQTVLGATMQRTASQSGVVPALSRAVRGGGIGGVVGHAVAGPWGAATGALIGDAVAELVETSGWKTVSASTKTSFANLLGAGDVARANALADALMKASPARFVGAGQSQSQNSNGKEQ